MTHIDTIRTRIDTEKSLHPFKDKVHKLRRLMAGDVSALDDNGGNSADIESPEHYRQIETQFYDILVTDIEEGRSNKLMQAVRTLAFQVAYSAPDVEAEDLPPVLAGYLSGWAKDRLTRCNAVHHMRLSLVDYLNGGFGWAHVCYQDGYPVIRTVDTMDMAWDRTATIPSDIKWAASRVRKPLYWWIKTYGGKGFADLFTKNDKPSLDRPVECWVYYDINDAGTMTILRADTLDSTPVKVLENPYRTSSNEPFLAYDSMHYFAMPSVCEPIGVVEMMLPAQIAHWEGMKRIRDTIRSGAGFYDVEKGTYDPAQLELLNSGEVNVVLERSMGKMPVTRVPGAEIAQSDVQWVQQAEREMTEHGGANPYAGGTTVQNTKFAAEVNAVQSQAGLTAGVIAKDNARFWERIIKKFVQVGAMYDDQPLTLVYDGAKHEFDESDPIKDYLDPNADIVIQEDTMSFVPRQQRIQQSTALLQTVLPMGQMYPKAVSNAVERILRDYGIKNVAEWLQSAPQAQAMDPASMAQASTAQ